MTPPHLQTSPSSSNRITLSFLPLAPLRRVRELRQPRQRPGCHPIDERLPDRHEETQGAAEEAEGRQPPLLAPAHSQPAPNPAAGAAVAHRENAGQTPEVFSPRLTERDTGVWNGAGIQARLSVFAVTFKKMS